MLPKPRDLAAASAVLALQMHAVAAHAHHPTGSMVPTSFLNGLLSGIGHPILGVDHFAFVVGIGLIAAIAGIGLILPVLFIAAMAAGLAMHVAGIAIPSAEILLALSVLLIGVAVLRGPVLSGGWRAGSLFALAGVLHGHAFAETVIGAEPTPIIAYIIGLCATQMTIAMAAYFLAHSEPENSPILSPAAVRGVGVLIAAVGACFLVINSLLTA